MLNKVKERREIVTKRFDVIDRISYVNPKAAFYIFPSIDLRNTKWKDDKEFVLDFLREKQALLVHGSGFGKEYGSDHFRLVYLANPEYLNEGLDRLSDFLK